jgi:CubicO group peptidase (beta-lactamase class C family)
MVTAAENCHSDTMRTVHLETSTTRPTLADWLRPPGNKWSFGHARELFSSERVAAGVPSQLAASQAKLEEVPGMASYLERSHTDALVVVHHNNLVTEWYAPHASPEDRHILFSVTKSVIGLVASALISTGALDSSAPVSNYVPEVAGSGYASATVRDLLDMRADIDFVEDYEGEDLRRYREASGQIPTPDSEGIRAFVTGLEATGPHGGAFKYVSPTTDLAAWVCERASGTRLAILISTYVWRPMGAEHDADLLLDRFGSPRASGGLCASARDMARIGRLLLPKSSDAKTAKMVRDVKSEGDRTAWATGSLAAFLADATYRDFWFQPAEDPNTFLAAGIYGQRIYVDVPRNIVIAQQASLPSSFDQETWAETLPTFREVARQLASN